MATNSSQSAARQGNGWLQFVLLAMMSFVFVTAAFLIYMVLATPTPPPTANAPSTTAASPSQAAAPGTSSNAAPQLSSLPTLLPGSYGVFDTNPSSSLPTYAKYLIATVILTTAAILEMFLIILYAAFFVNDPANAQFPLGLPQATVRVFLVGIIVLVILVFAVLPDLWGSNKAVVLLFGLLSTVIGFYFGSRAVADATPTAGGTVVRLTLDAGANSQTKVSLKPTAGTLDANFQTTLGVTSLSVVAVLLDTQGTPVRDSQSIAVADRTGKVEFDFTAAFSGAVPPSSYIVRVLSPASVVCDERIRLTA